MSEQRKEILEKLYKADDKHRYEVNFIKDCLNIDYYDIYSNVVWLEEYLNLNEIKQRLDRSLNKYFNGENQLLSSKQYSCYKDAIKHLFNDNFGKSYHEICDFIHNYELTKDKDISEIEKILLSFWVDMFLERYYDHRDRKK